MTIMLKLLFLTLKKIYKMYLRLHVTYIIIIKTKKHFRILHIKSKKISNDQELIQLDPISCPQNQKGKDEILKLTAVYERHTR